MSKDIPLIGALRYECMGSAVQIMSDSARANVATEKLTKFKFKRLKVQVLTILDDQKKEVGSVRVEPGEIAWRPAGESRWYTLPIRDFGKLAVAHGVKGETGK